MPVRRAGERGGAVTVVGEGEPGGSAPVLVSDGASVPPVVVTVKAPADADRERGVVGAGDRGGWFDRQGEGLRRVRCRRRCWR